MKKIKSSIQYKLILCFILSFLLFANISIYLWYHNSTKHAQNTSAAYMKQLMSVTNTNLEVALKDIQSILYTLSVNDINNAKLHTILQKSSYNSEKEQYQDEIILQEFLSRMSNNKFYLNGLTVFNLNGQFYQNGVTMPFHQMRQQEWFSKILESNQSCVFIEPHYYNTLPNESSVNPYKNMVFSYAKAIITNNTIIGYIVADVKCDILMDIFGQTEMLNEMQILLVDSKYHKPIFFPINNNSYTFSEAQVNELMEDMSSSGAYFYKTIDGVKYITVALNSEFTGWTTLGLIPLSSTLRDFYSARTQLVVLSVLLAFFIILLVWIFSSIVTRNLKKLTEAVSTISKDNLSYQLTIKSEDETGRLSAQIQAMVERIKELIFETKKTEQEKRKAEMKFLQSQINPHFLYNTLNSIKFLASIHNLDNIVTITESLTSLMRTNLDKKLFLTLGEEVTYLESYLNIQSYKYSTLTYNIQIDKEIKDTMVLKLLVQPIVENAITHSVSSPTHPVILNIKIYEDDNKLKIQVTDNGCGLTKAQMNAILSGTYHSSGNGVALNNIISRIHLYFGVEYGLEINSQPNMFTTMILTLPILTESEAKHYV